MKVNGKRIMLVTLALSTFFATAISYSARNRWNARMVVDPPAKADKTSTEAPVVSASPTPIDSQLACRTAQISVARFWQTETRWAEQSSTAAVPYLQSGGVHHMNCITPLPKLVGANGSDVQEGTIDIKCVDGILKITNNSCKAKSDQQLADEAAAAAAAEAARIAEEKRKADEAAAAEAARVAAAQAAAAAAAAAAAGCPSNCGGGPGTYTGGSTGKNASQWSVTYQACNNGQKIVRSSGKPSSFAVGACYNSIP
jgi:F0F1-type ATP synthase epsilon subunit